MSKRKGQLDISSFFKKKVLKVSEEILTERDASTSANAVEEIGAMDSSEVNDFDIGNFIEIKTMTDEEKFRILEHTWIPPSSYVFPCVMQSGGKRSFQRAWLNEFTWLCYSAKYSGGYCKPCVLFASKEAGRSKVSLGSFILKPFQNFKKGKEMMQKHASNEYHKKAIILWADFIRTFEDRTQSIDVKLNSEMQRVIKNNRLFLTSVIKTIILCGRQNIPLRGHRDDGNLNLMEDVNNTENDGNFRSLLRFRIDAGDSILHDHLKNGPKNATFISKTTQNELISICGDIVLDKILQTVKKNRFFSILADETTDAGTIEQLSLSLRYFDAISKKIREEFVGFIEARNVSGEHLAQLILENLKILGLEIGNLRGQGYDGCSNMSGKFKGVQARIKEKQPLATFMHCASHKLNLAISKACSLTSIRNTIGIIKEVVNAVRGSAKRMGLMQEEIEEHYPKETKLKLKKLCETRWVERHDSILQFLSVFDAIVCFLEHFDEGECTSQSAFLLSSVLRFDFIIALHIISSLFSITVSLSRNLQNPSIDLKQSYNMVKCVIDTLNEYRNSSSRYSEIFSKASNLAEKHSIQIVMPRIANRQLHRNNVPAIVPKEYYRLNVFLPFLDFMISELETKFPITEHADVVELYGLIPAFANENIDALIKASEIYCDDLPGTMPELRGEIELWQRQWKNKPENELPFTAIESLLSATTNFYPNIQTLLHILCVLPVTTCTSERSFSTLRRVKTYLRSNMNEERLNGLCMLCIHRDVEIHPEEVLTKFALKDNRKLKLKNL